MVCKQCGGPARQRGQPACPRCRRPSWLLHHMFPPSRATLQSVHGLFDSFVTRPGLACRCLSSSCCGLGLHPVPGCRLLGPCCAHSMCMQLPQSTSRPLALAPQLLLPDEGLLLSCVAAHRLTHIPVPAALLCGAGPVGWQLKLQLRSVAASFRVLPAVLLTVPPL